MNSEKPETHDLSSSAFLSGLCTGAGFGMAMLALIWTIDWLPITTGWPYPIEYAWAGVAALLLVVGYGLYRYAGAEQATLEATITDTRDGS